MSRFGVAEIKPCPPPQVCYCVSHKVQEVLEKKVQLGVQDRAGKMRGVGVVSWTIRHNEVACSS
jgi:hypothetical protein